MTDFPTSFAALFQKGIENAAHLQKIALEMYARETDCVLDSWEKFAFPGAAPVLQAARLGMRDFAQMQRNFLDLFVRQSLKEIEGIKPVELAAIPDEPNRDCIDTLITEHDKQEAAKVVDKIVADLAGNAAVQQKKRSHHAARH